MSEPKRLYRSTTNRMICGICGGLAEYLGVDPTLVRLLAVVGLVFTGGTLGIGYLIALFIVPEGPSDQRA